MELSFSLVRGGRVDLAWHGDGKRDKYFLLVMLWLNGVCKLIERGVLIKITVVARHKTHYVMPNLIEPRTRSR